MTEIEKKALALLNEATNSNSDDIEDFNRSGVLKALLHAIEQHEAFRQEVSDAVSKLTYDQRQFTFVRGEVLGHLERFVLKAPADPLVEALCEMAPDTMPNEADADNLRAALAKRGLQVTEIER